MKLGRRSTLSTVALAVGDALSRHGIRAVLTGGACASLYTRGAYQSADVDYVLAGRVTLDRLDEAMAEVGFSRRGDRYTHPSLPWFVEFPRGPLAIGEDLGVRPVRRRSGRVAAWALSATDCCRDRLAAFFHWNDRQSLRVAVEIALRNRVSLPRIRRWSESEGAAERYAEFERDLERARKRRGARGPR